MKEKRMIIKRLLCSVMLMALVLVLLPMASARAEETGTPAVQTVDVGIPVEEHPELFMPRSMPTHGEGKIAVFLIDFPDYPNENPNATREYYDGLYFTGGVDKYWNSSVARFYREQSYGKLHLSGQVFDWYTAKHERSYYDDRKGELIMEAAEYYRTQGVDFSQFDGDGNGVIDAITFHFAGDASEVRNTPWYSGLCMSMDTGFGEIDGLKFTTIVQVREEAVATGNSKLISTTCHELMHTLGMLDLYSEAAHMDPPVYDLMGGNLPVLNPYTKLLLGWIDEVQVITGDADQVRLNLYGKATAGDIAIVTDVFNGFFDEFYLVAYQGVWSTAPAVWHIDARLNEQGNAFRFQNLYYIPRPDKGNIHGVSTVSDYMFIEELSAHPAYNHILQTPTLASTMYFGEDSVLGPNSAPSSDTHDGQYTGIQIDNFVEHKTELYMTFDVAFVQDTSAPEVITKGEELELVEMITLRFNEAVYEGENWEDILVTDMAGNPLEVTVLRTHYPTHEIEITFQQDDYRRGYKIILPENSLRDSSGNGIKAVTLTPPVDRYMFPDSEVQLPNVSELGEYMRDNARAKFFPQEDNILVITSLWEKDKQTNGNIPGAKIELLRLDYEGNVLSQRIVDNPFHESLAVLPFETADGNYIFFCQADGAHRTNVLACFDGNGELKWINDDYVNTDIDFQFRVDQVLVKEEGLLFLMDDQSNGGLQYAFVDAQTGRIEMAEVTLEGQTRNLLQYFGAEAMDLGNGTFLCARVSATGNGCRVHWRIYDAETYKLIMESKETLVLDEFYTPEFAAAYDDGSVLVYCENDQKGIALLLDAELKMIKSVPLEMKCDAYDAFINNFWIAGDGFCEWIGTGSYAGDRTYQIRRYDRYLNMLWEANVYAEFAYFFKAPDGRLMAYKTVLLPERECYVEHYGVEPKHTHNLVYVEQIEPGCLKDGRAAYWSCEVCGCCFADEGENLLAQQTIPAKGHSEVIDEAKAATCTEAGLTEGKHCDLCDKILLAQNEIPATGHSFGDWSVAKEATAEAEGEEIRTCAECGATETRSIAKLPAVDDPAVDDPADDKPAEKNNTTLIIIAAGAAVVGIAVVAVLLLKKKK